VILLGPLLLACADPAPPAPAPGGGEGGEVVRFVAFGDAGEGNATQREVARAAAQVCAARGCDFVLYLGDNLYHDGAEGPDDPQFQEKFEGPNAPLELPFYVVVGNHDYGPWTVERDRAQAQLAYAARSEKWVMPSLYYRFQFGDVAFYALDTNALYSGWALGWAGAQEEWLAAALAQETAPWTVVFGHHPWRSNGRHGDAGSYEGVPLLGAWLEGVFEDRLCGRADLYLSGHDHNRQWLAPECGVELVVSGAGAKVTPLVRRGPTPTLWEDDQSAGFAWFEIDGDRLYGAFYDQEGAPGFERTVEKDLAKGASP
jgi:tartrate-resistant acid phosphatase type 5